MPLDVDILNTLHIFTQDFYYYSTTCDWRSCVWLCSVLLCII